MDDLDLLMCHINDWEMPETWKDALPDIDDMKKFLDAVPDE